MKNDAVVVVVSALGVNKIYESFTHNPLTLAQGNPTFISLVGSHKYCIANVIEFGSNSGGGQHG